MSLLELIFSAKRREEFKGMQEFTGALSQGILKPCETRWLSLFPCVQRLLSQYAALRAYFDSHPEAEKAGRVKRCAEAFRGELLRLHLLFLAFIMVPMNKFNALFQVCTLLRILLI